MQTGDLKAQRAAAMCFSRLHLQQSVTTLSTWNGRALFSWWLPSSQQARGCGFVSKINSRFIYCQQRTEVNTFSATIVMYNNFRQT
jgi:hypothetical protein